MHIKTSLLHVLPIAMGKAKCIIAVHSELPLSAKASLILKFKQMFGNSFSRDKAAATISAKQ